VVEPVTPRPAEAGGTKLFAARTPRSVGCWVGAEELEPRHLPRKSGRGSRPSPSEWCSDDHHVGFGWLV
jgi:hypothetical protein